MSAEFYSYEGLRNSATFLLDATTVTALGDDKGAIVGKAVALTGNYTVGYGTSGDTPVGFVVAIEKESANSDNYVVSVEFNVSREGLACAGSETAGNSLAVNGSGGFVASNSATSATAWAVNATAKTCTAYIHG